MDIFGAQVSACRSFYICSCFSSYCSSCILCRRRDKDRGLHFFICEISECKVASTLNSCINPYARERHWKVSLMVHVNITVISYAWILLKCGFHIILTNSFPLTLGNLLWRQSISTKVDFFRKKLTYLLKTVIAGPLRFFLSTYLLYSLDIAFSKSLVHFCCYFIDLEKKESVSSLVSW